jgi:hypothetical protein
MSVDQSRGTGGAWLPPTTARERGSSGVTAALRRNDGGGGYRGEGAHAGCRRRSTDVLSFSTGPCLVSA